MRVGKKANVVEAKKTRSCVVRLENVLSPPARSTRSAGTPGSGSSAKTQQSQDEKKSKGPLKKRPISQQPVSFTNLSTTPTIKSKAKLQQKPITKATVIETPPPSTIAAGRSRRAIKPNPKYASEDIVTPKSIKNVGALSNRKSAVALGKQRGRSTSSSEDFYNKESSDDLADDDDLDELHDKLYNVNKDKDSDSDFSNGKKRLRGRPKREDLTTLETSRTAQSETPRNSVTKSSLSISKSTPSQLQQLRKTLAASVNRSLTIDTPTIGMKRKREPGTGIGTDNDSGITRKRFLLSSTSVKYKSLVRTPTAIAKETDSKKENSQTLNGSKIQVHTLTSTALSDSLEKRKLAAEKIANKFHVKSIPISSKATTNAITLSKSSANARVIASTKQRSSSPATPKQPTKTVAAIPEKANKGSEKKVEDSPSSTVDDFETMPTFTIVNINDIINKKGDVLISKTAGKLHKSTENSKAEGNDKMSATAASSSSATSTLAESKLNRRKTGHTTILSEKTTPAAVPKKTIQKILNHSLAKKSLAVKTAAGSAKTSPDKPAPRILNAMVAKKTQPVKPMIANLDDSADESFPLSLDDDDDDEDDDDDDNNNGNEDGDATQTNEDDSFTGGNKRKLASSTPYLSSKKVPAPTTKENSIKATNRIPPATRAIPQRKLSPEKVVISRQGDKIIKKITCFETWYVINIPEERPPKVVRNQLDIPLIKLANVSESVELPSESWSSKVTLHELSAAMVAKSNIITYIGDLKEHNIAEEDRARYQPTCVMFRRAVVDRAKSRLPYDRAVIFKNKTFFTNIEGKNVKLIGAPTSIGTQSEVEILLQVVDGLTLQSSLVEPATTVQ